MYTIIYDTEESNAVTYDNKNDIRIKVCYPKYDMRKKEEAIKTFWKELERMSINSHIVKGHY